ncbi:alpha-N-acetylgalactosaminidase-like isoform X2 [Rhodnius prolixus]|uniref:alpha-N-acetylgalactosaminidase-like isoform X2 n=1 Tax=Rhodnius prolixus TaxID=13249 RepID=UPI003D187827
MFFQISLYFILILNCVTSLENGLALTPPMGFNTWQRYRCTVNCEDFPDECISDCLIRRTADILQKEYLKYGYNYLVLDDCWLANSRDEQGYLIPNETRFPNGIKDLVKYVHSKGLKFGIYGNFGEKTCAGFPGIKYDLQRDAQTFASWEVDFVKLDGCFSDTEEKALGYPEFGRYLNRTGRKIVYSCSWPAYLEEQSMQPNFTQLVEYCNLWRNYDDIEDSWSSVVDVVDYFAEHQNYIGTYHGPGHWNDPDMLVIGNFGLSYDQSKAHMAIWCILAAPLFISADLANMKPDMKNILVNAIAISIDQDPMGIPGRRIYKRRGLEIWRKPILPQNKGYFSFGIVFLNKRTGMPTIFYKTATELGLYNPPGYIVKDVFEGSESKWVDVIKIKVNPSGVVFLKFTVICD